MHRLFLVSDDEDFAQWVEKELSDYGRFVRKIDDFEFFIQQWSTSEAEIIIATEYAIESEDSFFKILNQVEIQDPFITIMLIYFREEDAFIQNLKDRNVVCISWNDLDFGLMKKRLEQSRSIKELQTRAESYPQMHSSNKSEYVSDDTDDTDVEIKIEQPEPTIQFGLEIVDKESPLENSLIENTEKHYVNSYSPIESKDLFNEEFEKKDEYIEKTYVESHQESSDETDQEDSPQLKVSEEKQSEEEVVLSRRNQTKKRYPKLPSLPKHENQIIYKDRVIINEKIIGTVLIAVASTNRRAGSSHNAIQIARYLSGNSFEVACVELLDINVNPSVFKFLDDGTKKSKKMDDGFHSEGIDFYPAANYEKYIKILNAEYQYVVVDLGQIVTNQGRKSKEGRFFKEFFRANISIISTFPAIWDFQFLVNLVDKLLNNSWNKPFNVLVNFTDDKRYKKFTDSFTSREKRNLQLQFYQNNFLPDPFDLEDDTISIVPEILSSVIPSSKKKKRFYFF